MKKILLCFIVFLNVTFVFSQNNSFWKKEALITYSKVKTNKQDIKDPTIYSLNIESLKQVLLNAPNKFDSKKTSNVVISFPNADGQLESFRIKEASIMHPDLQARYPDIRSYVGQGIENSSETIRFSVSPLGFHSMTLAGDKRATFIEPYTDDLTYYRIYNRSERMNPNDDFECEVITQMDKKISTGKSASTLKNADDGILRTYRLAVSASGEYTSYHGGTKALALAAINTTMTRVNGIYESDFNVTMQLIANTDAVIYTSTTTDPYGNTTSGYNSALQSTLTNVIGEANYDIGHLVANLQNNGNAGCIGCVCVNNQKGSGWTSHTVPEGDNFDVDYVAHEMGHQFGGNHTWTHGGNEGSGAQMEPGSGSTIMGYAGITGATDVQPHSDPYFHAISIQQITNYIKSTSCQTNIATGNAVPTASAGADFTIPKGTPFVLTGSGTDANSGDALTYCWEQMNNGSSSTTNPSPTATSGPAFRSFNPTTDTKRYFPRLETIKTGSTSWQWEAIPNVARTLNFRLTVRDNVAGGGNNNSDDAIISVNGTAGPFIVNSPNTSVIWNAGTTQTVTWNVAGTTANGVNAANVDIYLSTDGGDTYPITLATGVANDGSQDITVPNNQGTQNRIMVKGSNHIFFDISNANFTIAQPVVCNATTPTGFAASDFGSTSATLSWNAVPGATYDLEYRQVGSGTWTTIGVSEVSQILSGLSLSTQYEAQVRSKCSDLSTSAFSSIINFSTLANLGCTGGIASYPYTESFEGSGSGGLGDWTQYTIAPDTFDWSVNSGGTSTSNTGPSSANNGNFYLYTEASGNAGGTAILISPCFDLNNKSAASFTYNYHMSGSDISSLSVQVSTDDGSNWSSNLWSLNGDQGDSWTSITINLDGYINEYIKLRFIGVIAGSRGQIRGDMAIDNIGLVATPSGPDVTPPSTPTGLITSNTTETTTDLSWNTSTDNIGVTGYDVYQNGVFLVNTTSVSYQVTGLTGSTSYSFYVIAKDAAGNSSGQSNTANTRTQDPPDTEAPTAPTNLVAANTTFESTDLSWVASTDNVGVTGYDIYQNNAFLVNVSTTSYQVIALSPSTPYTFYVIAKDAIGLSSGQSNTANITTEIFIDTEPPSPPPTGLSVSNTTETTTDLSWNASSDNVGVTGYDIYQNGAFLANTASVTYQVTGLTGSTSYSFYVIAKDAAGLNSGQSDTINVNTLAAPTCSDGIQNGDETGVDCGGTICPVCPATDTILHEGYFESGLDGWTLGGKDAFLSSTSLSYEGFQSIKLRDNTGIDASMSSPILDLSPYNQIEIDFYFYANSMETGKAVWLRYNDGSGWVTVATWASGSGFNDNAFNNVVFILDSGAYNLVNNGQFRIQCVASGKNDQVYIDQVVITGIGNNAASKFASSKLLNTTDNSELKTNLKIYPNPVEGDILNVQILESNNFGYKILNTIGQVVTQGKSNGEVNVHKLESGMYFIEVNDGDEIMTKKFIKK